MMMGREGHQAKMGLHTAEREHWESQHCSACNLSFYKTWGSGQGPQPGWLPAASHNVCVCVCVLVGQLCQTLCNPMDHIDFQAPLSKEFSGQKY